MPFASGKTPTRRQLFLGLAAAGLLAACTPQIDYRGYQPRGQDLARVQIGMTKAEVEALLGSPSTTATVNFQGDSYYYISSKIEQEAFLHPQEIDRKIVAIRFDQTDRVASFANYGLEDGRIIDINSRTTPTKGKELTILQQLFSNVGRFSGPPAGPGGPGGPGMPGGGG